MNRDVEIAPDDASFRRGMWVTQAALSITWKVVLSVTGIAVLVGSSRGKGGDWPSPSMDPTNEIAVASGDNVYKISTRLPSKEDMIHIDITGPNSNSNLHVTYDKKNLVYMHTDQTAPLHLGTARMPGGDQSITARSPMAHVNIRLLTNGELGVIVTTPEEDGSPLSEVWISPDGKVRSATHRSQ